MQHKLTIETSNEERVSYFLDNKHVATVTHDEHGWAGMELASNIFSAIATQCNMAVEYEDSEDE